jgi:archaellum component FlaC
VPIVYLTPEDLSPAQTSEVLAFLNSAKSAQEIADRVEIPGELDVGLRVGQRILDHRAQLPDGFANLTQLMDVNQVGPERFTEILATILGIALPGFSLDGLDDLVRREVAAQLKNVVPPVTAAEQYRITVQPPQTLPWLGQEITLTLKVTAAASGKPVANLPVSVESSDMWIGTQFGYDVREGQVVSSRTATDGSMRVRLRNLFVERLTMDQLGALQEALRSLDASAPAPRDMRAQLVLLVSLYEDLRNKNLRTAMDIVYQSTGRHLTDTLNQQDHLYEWSHHSGLLRIYLDADTQALQQSAVIANATAAEVGIYHVAWKQWLMPWYQVYQEQLSGSDLQQSFLVAKQRIDSEAGLTAEILGQAYRFVAEKNGLVGEALGKKVIDREIQRFLAREISTLPATTQLSMYPSLLLAGNTINSADTGTLALVNQSRADIEGVLDQRINDTVLNNDEILGSIGTLNTRVDQLDNQVLTQGNDFGELQLQVTGIRGDIDTLDSNLIGVQGNIGQINSRLDVIDTNVLDLDLVFQRVTKDFDQLEVDFGRIGSTVDTLNKSFTQLDTEVQRIDADLTKVIIDIPRIDAEVLRVSADVQGVNAGLTRITTDMQGINTGLAGITNEMQRIDNGLGQITADFQGIDASLTRVATEVQGIDSGLAKVTGEVQQVDLGLQNVDSRVSGINNSVATLDNRFTGLDKSVSALNRDAVLTSDITRDGRGRFTGIKNKTRS